MGRIIEVILLESSLNKVSKGFALCSLLLLVYGLWFRPLNVDGGFFLYVATALAENPTKALTSEMGYGPLPILFQSLFIEPGKILDWRFFLIINFVLIFANSFLLLRFLNQINPKNKNLQLWIASTYLLYQLLLEGVDLISETWVIFFCLLALNLSPKKITSVFLAGVFCSLSFMSKQYGLASIGILVAYLWIYRVNGVLRAITAAITGFALGFLGFSYLVFLGDISRIEEWFTPVSTYGFRDLGSTVLALIIFALLRFPFPILLTSVYRPNEQNRKLLIFGSLSALVFLPAFYFKQHLHYFHLLLPFLLLVIASFYPLKNKRIALSQTQFAFLFGLCTIVSLSTSVRSLKKSHHWSRLEQNKIAVELKKHIPPGSIVYIDDNRFQPMRYLNSWEIPREGDLRSGFTNYFDENSLSEMRAGSDFLILSSPIENRAFEELKIEGLNAFIYLRKGE